jgi:branched-chain amino acid transport system permease protein
METMSSNQLSTSTSPQHTTSRRKWGKPAVYAGLLIIIALLPILLDSPYVLYVLTLTFIYTLAAVSLRTIIISGQFPLAHGAFMGIGAYFAAIASKTWGWPPWATIPVGGLVAMGIGMLIGYPFSRLRALYYAMGSLFFGLGVFYIISAGGHWTGGYSGITGIPPMFTTSESYYYFFLVLTIVSIVALYRFEFSRIGVNLKAIAQSHLVASHIGINEGWYRIMVLGVGCFFVGLVGASYAHFNTVLSPSTFGLMATLWLVMYVLIGGIDSFAGPIIGTFIMFLVPEYFFRGLKVYSPYVGAAILFIVVYLMPKGIAGVPEFIRSRYEKRREGKRAPHAVRD